MCPTLQSWRSALNENLLHAGCPVSNVTKNIMFLSSGAFHLSELSGQIIPAVTGISLLIRTIQPGHRWPKIGA